MATISKSQLATENAALRKQVADLKVDVSLEHNQRISVMASADKLVEQNNALRHELDKARAHTGWRVVTMPRWQVDRAAAMAAAREIAMQTRMTIKV